MVNPANRNTNRSQQPSPNIPVPRRRSPKGDSTLTSVIKIVAATIFCSILYNAFNRPSTMSAFKECTPLIKVPGIQWNDIYQPPQEYGPQLTPSLECALSHLVEHAPTLEAESHGTMHLTSNPLVRYSYNRRPSPKELESYMMHVGDLIPRSSSPLKSFPENLSAFLFNEFFLINNGETACNADQKLNVNIEDCEATHEYLLKHFKSDPNEIAPLGTFDRGYNITLVKDNGKYPARRGIDPVLHANYHRTIKQLEATWLNDPCFFERSVPEIEASLLEMYSLFTQPHCQDEEDEKTGYRQKEMIRNRPVNDTASDVENEFVDIVMKDRVRMLELIAAFKNGKAEDNERIIDSFTSEEKRLLSINMHFLAGVKEIPKLMQEFLAKLKDYVTRDVHPVALAAWVHGQLARIAPFPISYDEFSLLLTNAFLQAGGYMAVTIPDEKLYKIAIDKEIVSPGYFAYYLATLIKNQTEERPRLSYRIAL